MLLLIVYLLVILLPIYAIAYKERIKRINSIRDKQAYNIGSALAAQVHLRDKNPTFMRRVDSILSEALGIKYTSEIDKALENDKARLARAIRGICENKRTVVEDNYNKFVKSACDSKLGNLTESEIIETMVNGEANFEFSHLPYKVFQRSIDQLTPAVRIRQLRYRLKKRGFSEEERKRITDQEWHQFYNAIPTSFQENKEKKGTERIVEFTKRDEFKESAEACMVEFMKSLFPQAKSQKRVGKFLIEKLEAGKIGEYIRSNDRGFRIKEIHKDSGIPLRTIKRFCKELKEFANQKL